MPANGSLTVRYVLTAVIKAWQELMEKPQTEIIAVEAIRGKRWYCPNEFLVAESIYRRSQNARKCWVAPSRTPANQHRYHCDLEWVWS